MVIKLYSSIYKVFYYKNFWLTWQKLKLLTEYNIFNKYLYSAGTLIKIINIKLKKYNLVTTEEKNQETLQDRV